MKKNSKFIAIIVAFLIVAGGAAYYMKTAEPISEPSTVEVAAEQTETEEPPVEEVPSTEEVTEQQTETATTEEVPVVEETVAENEEQPSSEVSSEQANSNLTSQTDGETVQGELFPGINPEDINPGAIGHHIMPTEEEKKAAEEASGYKPPESAVGKTEEEVLKDKDVQDIKEGLDKAADVYGQGTWNSETGGWDFEGTETNGNLGGTLLPSGMIIMK